GAIGFLTTVEEIVNCRDQAGEPVGLPDMDSVVTSLAETCAPTSFPAIGEAIDCSSKDSHPQTYRVNNGDAKWLRSQHNGGLRGAFVYSNDSKDSMRG